MSEDDGPYLLDVGVIALAHAGTPVSDSALSYVQAGVTGDIDVVVPYSAVFGAHHVLTSYFGFSNEKASRLLGNFSESKRVHWYDQISADDVRGGLECTAELNIDGWDGYYARVAIEEGVQTILTLDDDFERVDGISAEIILSDDEFVRLNTYLEG